MKKHLPRVFFLIFEWTLDLNRIEKDFTHVSVSK
jgi:hypothetical protein